MDKRRVLTNPQMAIFRAGWSENARFRVAVCGRRFGKTYIAYEEIRRAARMSLIQNVSVENEIWYGAPTYKQAKRVFWPRLKQSIPKQWIVGKPNESELLIRYGPLGHIIRVVGLDNYENLRGSGLQFFIGDEWADVNISVWPEIIRPMLSTSRGHALFLGTPKGHDQLYDFYMKGQIGPTKEKGWWSRIYTTLDGGNVLVDEIQNARKSMDSRQFRQEFEASFETFTGRCVYAFSRAHSIIDRVYNQRLPVHIGIDFNINPMSASVWQEYRNEKNDIIVFQVDEMVLSTSNTDELVVEIKKRFLPINCENYDIYNNIIVYPDPAGAANRTSSQGRTDLSILRSAGFNVRAMARAPLVRDRINFTNSMFENSFGERRAFVASWCRNSIECYERYTYRDGSSEPDKSKGYDHLVDATGYYLFARFNENKIRTSKVNVTNR